MKIPFFHDILELVLPRRCAVCGTALDSDEADICSSCREGLPLTWFWDRRENPMADKLNDRIQVLRDKADDRQYEPYVQAAALFFYRGDYKEITKSVKYRNALGLGRDMGEELGRKLMGSALFSDVDAVVPVPLHAFRKFRRGYNQAEIIARGAASALAVPVIADSLHRKRRTGTQTRLSVEQKAANVAGVFSVDNAKALQGFSHILLVDDVFTTGSTLAECCRTLRLALGPKVRISVCTLAVVGE